MKRFEVIKLAFAFWICSRPLCYFFMWILDNSGLVSNPEVCFDYVPVDPDCKAQNLRYIISHYLMGFSSAFVVLWVFKKSRISLFMVIFLPVISILGTFFSITIIERPIKIWAIKIARDILGLTNYWTIIDFIQTFFVFIPIDLLWAFLLSYSILKTDFWIRNRKSSANSLL